MTTNKAGEQTPTQSTPAAKPDEQVPTWFQKFAESDKAWKDTMAGTVGGLQGSMKTKGKADPFTAGHSDDDVGRQDFMEQVRQTARQEYAEMQMQPVRERVAKAFGLALDDLKGMSLDALSKMEAQAGQVNKNANGNAPKPGQNFDGTGGRGSLAGGGTQDDKEFMKALADGEVTGADAIKRGLEIAKNLGVRP